MMELRLNVLSPRKKARFLSLARFLFIKEILEYIIFTCALLAICYLVGWLLLTHVLSDLSQSALLINHASPAVNQEIRAVNTGSSQILAAAKEYEPLTPKLLQLIGTLPASIALSGVTIDRTTNTLTLTGTAATRDDLLIYETALGKLPWLKNVTSPPSELFQATNVSFQITAQLTGLVPLAHHAASHPAPSSDFDQ